MMKMQKKIGPALFALMLLTAVSCSEAVNKYLNVIKPPTEAEFNQVRNDALQGITQTQTFKAEDGIDFTSKEGAHFTIEPNSMYLNGNLVTGDVTLEFVELYKRGDMLVVNKPLMGTAGDGITKGPLITGGQFYVNVTKENQQVTANYNLTVPTANTGDFNPNMSLWQGEEDENGNMVWNEVVMRMTDNENIGAVIGGGGENLNEYNIFGSYFNWTNIDILYSLPEPKTQVWVKVPTGYDYKNCSIYVAYKDQPGALAYMDVWDTDKEMFTEHYGLAPIGFNFYVIFISTQSDGKYIYAYQDVTVEENKIITFNSSDLKQIDKDALIALINNLE